MYLEGVKRGLYIITIIMLEGADLKRALGDE